MPRTENGASEAIRLFERAIDLEPGYAAAYAGLADAYFVLGWDLGTLPPRDAFPRGRAAALRALRIDPANSDAHASLSWEKLWYEWDWAGAEYEAKAAINANPNSATAHHHYSRYLAMMGRFDESLRESRRTLELDPISPFGRGNLAWNCYMARQYTTSLEQSRLMVEMYPNMPGFHAFQGLALEEQGHVQEAVGQFEQAVKLAPWHMSLAQLGYAYGISGNRAAARKVLNGFFEHSREAYVPAYNFAVVYLGVHQDDEAFRWLNKAFEERSPYLVNLKVYPIFDRLRSDPRFIDLLRRIGFAR